MTILDIASLISKPIRFCADLSVMFLPENSRIQCKAVSVVAVVTLLTFVSVASGQAQRPDQQSNRQPAQQRAAIPVTEPLAAASELAVVFDRDAGTETVALFGVLELSHGGRVGIQSRFVRTRVSQPVPRSQPKSQPRSQPRSRPKSVEGSIAAVNSASAPVSAASLDAVSDVTDENALETWRYQSIVVNVTTLTADSPHGAADPFYRLPIQISRASLGLAGMTPTKPVTKAATTAARAATTRPEGQDADDLAPKESAPGAVVPAKVVSGEVAPSEVAPKGAAVGGDTAYDAQMSTNDVAASVWVNHVSLDWLSPEGCQSPLQFSSHYNDAALDIVLVATSCSITRQTNGFDSQYQRLSVLSGQWHHEHGGKVVGGEIWLERVTTEASLAAFAGLSEPSTDAIQDFLPPVVTERWLIAVEAAGAAESGSDNPNRLDTTKDPVVKSDIIKGDPIKSDRIKSDSIPETANRVDNGTRGNVSEAPAARTHLIVIERSRRRSGTGRAIVSGTMVDAERGVATSLDYRQLAVAALNNWQHPATGQRYETGWVIDLPTIKLPAVDRPSNSTIPHATVSSLSLAAPAHSVDQTITLGGEERWVGWLSAVSGGVSFAFAEMEALP